MPVFAYKGVDARGKTASGVKDAESPRVLRQQLRKEGILVTDISEERERVVSGKGLSREVDVKGMFDRVRPQDVAVVTRQLATLIRAGIPLAESLGALMEQATSDRLKRCMAEVRTAVNEGTSLADALGEHPKIFGDLYVNMVRAGEAAGNLDDVLGRLADFLDGQVKLKGKVQGAMVYPIVMALVGIAITAMLMVVVVPKSTEIFADMGRALPWNTQLLVWLSGITGSYWWLIIILSGLGWWGFRRWKKSEKGKPVWDAFLLRLWLVGPLVRMIAVGRFARILGTLLHGGVPLLQAGSRCLHPAPTGLPERLALEPFKALELTSGLGHGSSRTTFEGGSQMPELKLVPLDELLSEADRKVLMSELAELDVVELPPEMDDDAEVEEPLGDDHFADFLARLDAMDMAASIYLPVDFDGIVEVGDHTVGSATMLQEALEELREELELVEDPEEDDDEDGIDMEMIEERIRFTWHVFLRAANTCIDRQLPLLLVD